MVIGDGLQGMLETAAVAGRVGAGRYYDMDQNWLSGRGGRETKVCLGDYRPWDGGEDPIYGHRINFMNNDCAGDFPVLFQDMVNDENLETMGEQMCVWVNMDNCEECFRIRGQDCDPDMFHSTYTGPARTGTNGRETRFPWSHFQETPPPAPGMRVAAGNNSVEIFWDDRSEHSLDPDRGVIDFESYRVWKIHHWVRPAGLDPDAVPPTDMWGMIAEYDIESFIQPGVGGSDNLRTLGRNTGLEDAIYVPACLGDPRYAGLAEAMQQVVDADVNNRWLALPSLRGFDGTITPGLEGLVRWETEPAVLDTFFHVTGRVAAEGVVPKRAGRYYHFVDNDAQNGFLAYYAVTASDHALSYIEGEYYPAGYGVQEDPGINYTRTTPRPEAQTLQDRETMGTNIYVYPNPATTDALNEYLAQHPSMDDPTGVRVTWNNLPLAHNTIHIYTESADLVKTLHHDGHSQGGSISWNLVSRNGQEVTSGIYLYVVKSDGGFPDFQGRFVVIK
jgi:hypothetical protein